ncbi:hypothetical protein BQ8794_140185 [Mesorhizobium prunaredense]|uniref:Uncharacterized protein n=1 Tax=Mesorhizobium prunaredense TaxID=1631249 RepID=A0A1R3V2E0_9HYPH|nr:hypothetical protein BQ8794_140185 [Mesorhizobium prunaredense]
MVGFTATAEIRASVLGGNGSFFLLVMAAGSIVALSSEAAAPHSGATPHLRCNALPQTKSRTKFSL